MWNATAPEYKTDMDVVVEGNKIAAVLPKGSATDANAKAIFGDDNGGSRVEAALQASF